MQERPSRGRVDKQVVFCPKILKVYKNRTLLAVSDLMDSPFRVQREQDGSYSRGKSIPISYHQPENSGNNAPECTGNITDFGTSSMGTQGAG
jgi:hypothetical protein